VICCRYAGIATNNETFIYLGKLKPLERPDDRYFVEKQLHLWQERLKGARTAGKPEEAAHLAWVVEILAEALKTAHFE